MMLTLHISTLSMPPTLGNS